MSTLSRWSPAALLKLAALVAVLTIVLKAAAWWLTNSVGLLSDAMESLVNLAGALFGLLMVTIAARPADADHPYGHHKAEYFSAGFEGILIMAAAAAILWAAVQRLLSPQPLVQVGLGLVLSVLSAALNGALAWVMLRAGRAHRSAALEADARHLIADVWTTAAVVAAVAAVPLTGWWWLDPALAIAVALNIAREGLRLLRNAVGGLMDAALEPQLQQAIARTLAEFAHRRDGIDIVRFDHVITRRAGSWRFVDLHMHLPASWSLGRAAALRAEVEQALMSAIPGLRATIQLLPAEVEPGYVKNEAQP